MSYNRLITCSSLQSRPSVGVAVLVAGAVGNLPVGADLGGVAELGAHLRAWSDDFHLQDDDHLLGLAAHLVADVFLHLDDGEGGQLVAVHHVVELSGQHGEAVGELAVTEQQSVPGGTLRLESGLYILRILAATGFVVEKIIDFEQEIEEIGGFLFTKYSYILIRNLWAN